MGKDSRRMRKELRRFTKDKVDDLNPRDVVLAFIDEAMQRPLLQRVKLGFGLITRWQKLLPVQLREDKRSNEERTLQ